LTTPNPQPPLPLPFDPALDLRFDRVVALPPHRIWQAWTTPALLMQWFCPRPWTVVDCEVDLRPGGAFRTVMQSPEGQRYPNLGCFLTVSPGQRLVWTNGLAPDFRPVLPGTDASVDFKFTGVIDLRPEGDGTRYTAQVLHADTGTRDRHAAMGFEAGWGIALDQLVALMQRVD
jgi:uncharacterized protein YndB with AHSA1/START domain